MLGLLFKKESRPFGPNTRRSVKNLMQIIKSISSHLLKFLLQLQLILWNSHMLALNYCYSLTRCAPDEF